MTLTTDTIKKRLESVKWMVRDNEAQNIINDATTDELKSLDAEGILRLREALIDGIISDKDKAAMKKMVTNTQFQPVTDTPKFVVDLIKKELIDKAAIQSELTPELINRLYGAETKRLDWYEKLGADGDTIGRGQLSQSAYIDVKKTYSSVWAKYLTRVRLANHLSNINEAASNFDRFYQVVVPVSYTQYAILNVKSLEDFVVAAYLAIKINNATKNGRSSKDTVRFGVAIYHGMYNMVAAAQVAVKDEINWSPVEAELIKQGHTDEVDYVNEVVLK